MRVCRDFFCLKCGLLGHEVEECRKNKWAIVSAPHSPDVNMYRVWMRADSNIKYCFNCMEAAVGKEKRKPDGDPTPRRGKMGAERL